MNYKENILDYYNSIDQYRQDYMNWYITEHLWLLELRDKYNRPMEFLCACTAIFSINKKWSETKKLLMTYLEGEELKGLSLVLKKIQQLEECNFEDDCIMQILGGKKIQNFYGNLLRPYSKKYITIDRWAARICGEHRRVNPRLYDKLKDAYMEVAIEVGILPSKLQALLWCNLLYNNEKEIRRPYLTGTLQ